MTVDVPQPLQAPLVSVVIVTYNHERFLSHCLDRVLMQETDFPVEILVTEDRSTDGTRDIMLRYQQEYPDRIRLFFSKINLNTNEVSARAIRAAKGQYLVVMDGDDYWASPHKLAKQVRFLENHPECSLCFHNVEVVYDDGRYPTHRFYDSSPRFVFQKPSPQSLSTLADLVEGNFLATCSVMYRSESIRALPDWYETFPYGDWPLHILSAMHGDLGYIDECMAVYRIHANGFWSRQVTQETGWDIALTEQLIAAYNQVDAILGYRYTGRISKQLVPLHCLVSEKRSDAGQYAAARANVRELVKIVTRHPGLMQTRVMKAIAHALLPRPYTWSRRLRSSHRTIGRSRESDGSPEHEQAV